MTEANRQILKKNAHLIVISLILFIIFVSLVITVVFSLFSSPSYNNNNPRTIIEGNGTGGSEDTTAEGKEITRKESLVGNLLDKAPYNGKNFSFYYSYEKSEFVLYLPTTTQVAGNQEFDAFLKQNGVESRTWIRHLTVTNTKPTP